MCRRVTAYSSQTANPGGARRLGPRPLVSRLGRSIWPVCHGSPWLCMYCMSVKHVSGAAHVRRSNISSSRLRSLELRRPVVAGCSSVPGVGWRAYCVGSAAELCAAPAPVDTSLWCEMSPARGMQRPAEGGGGWRRWRTSNNAAIQGLGTLHVCVMYRSSCFRAEGAKSTAGAHIVIQYITYSDGRV